MRRRDFLGVAAASLALPAIGRAQGATTLKFIPQADLAVLDPIWTTAYVTRNHGQLVFDTLYGFDAQFRPVPQMVAGHTIEDDRKTWRLTLRDGLTFHDGSPVLARDCVASIRRWAARDAFGQTLIAATDELSADGDRVIVFKLKAPFPLLPAALGKPGSNLCPMMPQRLARTDPFTQVTEMVGSGPYRFKADERVPGSQAIYERFAAYKPRPDGEVVWNGGPKIAHFDRVEWHVIPDAATAAAAMQTGEMDWWELPTVDMVPLMRHAKGMRVEIKDPTGQNGCMRLNHLHPPFDNPAVRRALLGAVNQDDYMIAVGGEDPEMRHVPCGVFTPGTPMANGSGMEVLTRKRDTNASKRELAAAGYKGEKVVLMAPTDFPILKAMADVGADLMEKMGFHVDYQALDWGTVVQRRAKKEPPSQGGWSVFHTFWAGLDQATPAGHTFLRAQGSDAGTMGWPSDPKIEALRLAWLSAPDEAAQKSLAGELQAEAFTSVPYVPVGQNFYTTAWRGDIDGVVTGSPVFWNVRRI